MKNFTINSNINNSANNNKEEIVKFNLNGCNDNNNNNDDEKKEKFNLGQVSQFRCLF